MPTVIGRSEDDVLYGDNYVSGDAEVELVSVKKTGEQGNSTSFTPVFVDANRIAFMSYANNLVLGDTNSGGDVFVKNLITRQLTLVSSSSAGVAGNSGAYDFAVGGNSVAFSSPATNLVANDTNGAYDIFLKTLSTGATTRVSVDSAGVQANGNSYEPSLSANGGRVVFTSFATNLGPSDTNGVSDIYMRALSTNAVTRVSMSSTGVEANGPSGSGVLSPDGTKVLFVSSATNLVAGDTNGIEDLFLKNLVTGEVTLVNTNASGIQANGGAYSAKFSPDGARVMFHSSATNLVGGDTNATGDVFIKDLTSGMITRVSLSTNDLQSNNNSYAGQFSPDGRYVSFISAATNLVPEPDTNNNYDIFIRDLLTGQVTRVSGPTEASTPTGSGAEGVFSPDGLSLAFTTTAALAPGDNNGLSDVVLRPLTVASNDVLFGRSGDDVLRGLQGDDTLDGGLGNDTSTAARASTWRTTAPGRRAWSSPCPAKERRWAPRKPTR